MSEHAAENDAEFWRLREQHQAGDHGECPRAYCLHVRPGGWPIPPAKTERGQS